MIPLIITITFLLGLLIQDVLDLLIFLVVTHMLDFSPGVHTLKFILPAIIVFLG